MLSSAHHLVPGRPDVRPAARRAALRHRTGVHAARRGAAHRARPARQVPSAPRAFAAQGRAQGGCRCDPLPAAPHGRHASPCCWSSPWWSTLLFYPAPGDPAVLACGKGCRRRTARAGTAAARARTRRCTPVLAVPARHLLAGRDYSTRHRRPHCAAPCLGFSFQTDQPVTGLIPQRAAGDRLARASARWCSGCSLGVGAGLLSALRRGGIAERALTGLTLLATAMPVFILGLLLLMLFCGVPAVAAVPDATCRSPEDPRAWAAEPAAALDHAGAASRRRLRADDAQFACWRRWPRTTSAPSAPTAWASGGSSPGTRCAAR